MNDHQFQSPNSPPGKSLNQLPFKDFKLKDFNLKIFQGEKSIIYHAKEVEDLSDTLYKGETSLEKLYELKRVFRQFVSLEEVFTLFFQALDESKIAIKKEDNKVALAFMIEFMGKKDEVKITLMPEEAKIDTIVMKLCDKVKEIDNLKKEFKDYKNFTENKIKELEALVKNLSENVKNNIEFYNGEFKTSDEIVKLKTLKTKFKEKIDTNIMKYNELFLIENGVKTNLKKNIKKFTLLFRASKDGFSASNFHSKCDGKNNTVTLVETLNGKRFGGFANNAWDQRGGYISGSNGFIFSFDDKSIYYNKNSSYEIYCHSNYGPTFGGGHDFYICDNCNSSNSSYNNSDNSYNTNGKKCAMAGTYNFLVKDYEVYQLEFE